ncbi:MAG: hypothetical protein ABI567_00425 [Gammaproteobacteria bacterium]
MPATLPPSRLVAQATGLVGTAALLLIGAAALLQPLPPATRLAGRGAAPASWPTRSLPGSLAAAMPGTDGARPCDLGRDGYFRGQLFGALDQHIDWAGDRLLCAGMRRPDGAGIRLFFAGVEPAGAGRVSVIIGIDGRPETLAGAESPANLTIIDESGARFFSSTGPGRCWANVSAVTPLVTARGNPPGLRVEGLVYCVGALPALADRSSLTLGELRFAGRVADE